MKTQVHHIAFSTDQFEYYKNLFETVFSMTVSREEGEVPRRRIWFTEGIQINEQEALASENHLEFDHLGMSCDDHSLQLKQAFANDCSPHPKGTNWFKIPGELNIELK